MVVKYRDRVCISIGEETKNKLKAMGSKGDTYDEVITGLLGLVGVISNPDLAASLAKDSGMDPEFVKQLKKFYEGLIERGGKYRNFDYEAQKLTIRLDLLS